MRDFEIDHLPFNVDPEYFFEDEQPNPSVFERDEDLFPDTDPFEVDEVEPVITFNNNEEIEEPLYYDAFLEHVNNITRGISDPNSPLMRAERRRALSANGVPIDSDLADEILDEVVLK